MHWSMTPRMQRNKFGLVRHSRYFCKLIIVDAILGKDYANERVLEFHTLSKPFEDMYNRTKVPRMPW